MGMTFADARHLLEFRKGSRGGKAVTLGRLSLFLHASDIRALRSATGSDPMAQNWLDKYKWGNYADSFFRDVLIFDSIDSIDLSEYESATILHDIGEPLSHELEAKFDLAFDGGTLEHVFNFPVAIANLMKLVRLGGIVYSNNPANNLCGHGFYQFSPELMYRVFSAANGYELLFVRVAKARYVSVELSTSHSTYNVKDPAEVGHRVNLVTSSPVVIMTMAARNRICEPFAEKVLQSDYVRHWGSSAAEGFVEKAKAALRRDRPQLWSALLMGSYMRLKASLANRRYFQRVR